MMRFMLALVAAALAPLAAASAAERTVMLAVDNMTCELCPPIVQGSLAHVPGVIKAEVSAETHAALVTFDDEKTTLAALTAATANAGYPSRPMQPPASSK